MKQELANDTMREVMDWPSLGLGGQWLRANRFRCQTDFVSNACFATLYLVNPSFLSLRFLGFKPKS